MRMMALGLLGVALAIGLSATQGCQDNAQTNAQEQAPAPAPQVETFPPPDPLGVPEPVKAKDRSEAKAANDPLSASAGTIVMDVHNSNGTTTQVIVRKVGDVWVGPRGEQYYTRPTEDQLRAIYGF